MIYAASKNMTSLDKNEEQRRVETGEASSVSTRNMDRNGNAEPSKEWLNDVLDKVRVINTVDESDATLDVSMGRSIPKVWKTLKW